MLSSSNNRDRLIDISTTMSNSAGVSNTYLVRPRLPLRIYSKPKISGSYTHYPDSAGLSRTKRTKTRKTNGVQKIDLNKRKSPDYIEVIYREAVSKLKYLLAETYLPVDSSGKQQCVKSNYQSGRITKSGNDIDEQFYKDESFISEGSRMKDLNNDNVCLLPTPRPLSSKSIHPSKAYSNLALSIAELQSVPPEITSYIEQQEEYIEQMEQESQYCRSELTNLLSKVREVIAENEELHNKTKTGFLKYALDEHENRPENDCTSNEHSLACTSSIDSKMNKSLKILEGPNIIFESRISELEAQLTQAKLELRKVQEENQLNVKKLENSLSNGNVEISAQLNQTLRAKYDAEIKVEELQKALSAMRDREIESSQKAKRSMEMAQQMEFEKNQAETEVKRLKDELDRQHEKLREAAHEASRRITEERQQVERRYSQQVEQLSADITSQWNAANKSQLESEKQQRELLDLKRDLSQKQTIIDNLKKDLQNRISSLQSDLNQALTEKDMAEQEVIAAKLAAERNDRQTKQEQIRLQTEINAYKQRMERADADLVHCRRENLRLLEQIALLEKEINLNRMMYSEDFQRKDIIGQENKKETPTTTKLDMETKHVATVGDLEDALNKQAKLVSQLTTECQSLTQRLEANNVKHKEEMATLQSNIEYLSNKIKDSFHNQQALYNINASYNSPDQLNETKVMNQNGNTNPHNSQNTDYEINQMQNENDNDNREIYSKKLQKKDDLDERYDHSNQREYTLGGYINNNNSSNIYNIEDQSMEDKNGEQEKHLTDDQNVIDNTNLMESSYDQYGEYDESQYQEQEFKDNDQYKEQDNTHDMTQYSEQEYQENHSAINPSNEYTQ
ncbi:serologically defined colon cancer antigen 8 homolog isoform X1 [Polistes fuscatus]|uniref:serologically defined colon cancer antigen 8 homolog isoform X1 n=1 Tax=Polistes fuscatus TaxID=30207 RepID=UPI001CA89A58|nr:serologically defined colon cancer antigen 8 homolog isoform X1 [Polistes fuscatus]